MSLKKLGRYEIVAPLGQGAMGLVYEAHDPHINRAVAIKTIRVDQLAHDMAAEFEARFRCETQAGGRLQHPNIIGVYDAGRDQGLAFMVMELVRGGDLRQQLKPGQPLGFERSMGLMKELLSALNFAHEQGIVHRDIKPANVMLDLKGRVKLGDFGVAQIADAGGDGDGTPSMRDQGSTVGTLKYLSPEQIDGSKLDSRADLFAAGVVLYQLLTGNKPFEGESDFAVMQAIAQRDPARPSSLNLNLPAGIDAVVFKALAKNRDDRYASAWDFALALRAVTLQATPTGAGAQRPRTPGPSLPPARTPMLATPADEATRLARPAAPGAPKAPAAASRAPDQTLLRAEQARVAEVAAAVAAAAEQARQVAREAEAARQQAERAEQARAALERQRAAAASAAAAAEQARQDAEAARQRAEQAERAREALKLQRAQAQAEQEELAELAWTQAQEEEQARRATLARDAAAAEIELEAERLSALAALTVQATPATPPPTEATSGPVLGAAADSKAVVQASAVPAAESSIRAGALPVARGHGRAVLVVTTLAALAGGGWFVTRDVGKPPLAMTPTARASAPASGPVTTSAAAPAPAPAPATAPLTVAAPAARVPAPAPEPIAVPVPRLPAAVATAASSPASTGATLAQAEALERRDLSAAVAAYTTLASLATGADRKAAASAARRLWTLYRDGAKGLAANPQQAQRWYDRAKQVGAKLPEWAAERAGQAQTLPSPAGLPAAPRLAPAGIVIAPPVEVNVPAAAPSPPPAAAARDVREVGVAAPPAAPLPAAGVAAKPSVAELFERGQKLEGTSLRQAESAYRDAAQQGHGASQKRLWELLLKAGRASEAVRYQKEAWDQQVPGVPEPKSAIRL